jgi:hypothetical protein
VKKSDKSPTRVSATGHQTSIITTHPTLDASNIAMRMFSRRTQENFFKYMSENFDFDRMIEYGSMDLKNKELTIPNPAYRQASSRLGNARKKKYRLQAKLFQHQSS